MEYLYDSITIYYKDDNVHHAKLKYRKIYGPDKVVEDEKYIKPEEIEELKNNITNYYHDRGYIDFKVENLIILKDYKEDNMKEYDGVMLSHIDSVDNRNYDMMERIRRKNEHKKIKIKRIGALYLIITLAISGYVINKKLSAKASTGKIDNYIGMASDNKILWDINSINEVLNYIDNADNGNYGETIENRELCSKILQSYDKDTPVYKTVIDRFINAGGLVYLGDTKTSKSIIERLCMYGTNLVMGGDKYCAGGDSILTVQNFQVDKDGDMRKNRVMYATTTAESYLYKNLPPFIKYVILSKTERAVREIKFEFKKALIHSWWFINNYDSYDYDKLVEVLKQKKEECKKEIYDYYLNEDTIKNSKH